MVEIINRTQGLADRILNAQSDMGFAGILAGNNSGRVWVDRLDSPDMALVWSDGLQCFQFMGRDANQAFDTDIEPFIESTIIPFLKEMNLDFFEYASDVEAWYPVIAGALPKRVIHENWQYVYRSEAKIQARPDVSLPEAYRLHQIDEEFVTSMIHGNHVNNPDFLIDYIQGYWGSLENYLHLGNGYAATTGNQIAGFAITDLLYIKTYALGVQTLEQHRRRGLAGGLANRLIRDIYAKGYDIWWDCMQSNIASQKTAESAGLTLHHTYRVCWFTF